FNRGLASHLDLLGYARAFCGTYKWTIPFAWNLITEGYVEKHVVGVILSTIGLLFIGSYSHVLHNNTGKLPFYKEQGVRGLAPSLLGYSAHGACKYGFYEFFKKYYSDLAGTENAVKYKTLIYLAGSASAEVIADVALCPMEVVKVRVQTQPGYARGLSDGLPKIIRAEGYGGHYDEVHII
ncbi:hypothetical protein MKW98_029046, partial [Papaver atlanticum]